jgi:hypothetical protein
VTLTPLHPQPLLSSSTQPHTFQGLLSSLMHSYNFTNLCYFMFTLTDDFKIGLHAIFDIKQIINICLFIYLERKMLLSTYLEPGLVFPLS